jgi:hypothetical protein
MGKNRVKKEDFSKFSTGEIPVSTGPVDFLNRPGPVRSVTGPAGPVPALPRGYPSIFGDFVFFWSIIFEKIQ